MCMPADAMPPLGLPRSRLLCGCTLGLKAKAGLVRLASVQLLPTFASALHPSMFSVRQTQLSTLLSSWLIPLLLSYRSFLKALPLGW